MGRPKGKKSNVSNQNRLIKAAVRCIEQFGVDKTSIDDIAREAGLSRPTAYRTFRTRNDLLEHVAEHSISAMAARLKLKMKKFRTFADSLVLGVIAALGEAKKDKIFMATLEALGDRGLERYMLNPAGPTFGHVQAVWSEVIPQARATGELRGGLSDYDAATCICSMLCLLLLRDDLNRKEQQAFLRKFMLPALMSVAP